MLPAFLHYIYLTMNPVAENIGTMIFMITVNIMILKS